MRLHTFRFYMGEMLMSLLALSAGMYGMAAVNRWSFSVFLTLQGTAHCPCWNPLSIPSGAIFSFESGHMKPGDPLRLPQCSWQ